MRKLAALLLAVAGLLLGGCSAATPAPAAADAPPTPDTVAVVRDPVSIAIPRLGVVDDIVPVHVQEDGAMEVPPVDRTGWWADSPRPGEAGAALVLAHVNWQGQRGAFAQLHELQIGDVLTVVDTTGTARTFRIVERRTFKKTEFAAHHDILFRHGTTADLVAVTCGGRLVGHSYDSNVVVRATQVQVPS